MKMAVVIPLVLLVAGCASQHSYYTAERPHIQREQLIAESNRFPEPGQRDTYYWYQKDTSRNTKVGGKGSDYPAYGATAPPNYGGYGGSGYGRGYGRWSGYYDPWW